MALDIKDRVPTKPNRFLFTPEDGSSPFYAVLSRADEPTQEGTPINKELLDSMIQAENTVVSDTVSSMYGLSDTEKDVDHALQKVPSVVTQYVKLAETTVTLTSSTATIELLQNTIDFDEILIYTNSPYVQDIKSLKWGFNNTTGHRFSTRYGVYSTFANVKKGAANTNTDKIFMFGSLYDPNSLGAIDYEYEIPFSDMFNTNKTFSIYCSSTISVKIKIVGVKYHES